MLIFGRPASALFEWSYRLGTRVRPARPQILQQQTAPQLRDRMERFLRSYGGLPVRPAGRDSVGEAPFVSGQYLAVSCTPEKRQRVGLAWAYIDDGWRAWPMYHFFPLDHCG
jgi:hypothetical protein